MNSSANQVASSPLSVTAGFGVAPRTQKEYENWKKDELERLNREYGVIEDIEQLRGWHLVEAELRKPGVYRIVTSRYTRNGAELRHGFASQRLITTARELGYLSAPNGFTLPSPNK
jgi:hypothetical protein